MNKLIKFLSVVVVLLVAVVIGGMAVLKSKDFNEYKGLIAEKVKEATGRDLAIAGNLDLRISLSPALAVQGVSFSNASWGSRPQMMTLKSLEAQVSLLPLLLGTVSIDRVVLTGLDVLAETDAQGRGNWEFGKPGGGKVPEAAKEGGGAAGAQIPEVKRVQIRDVAVTYRDGKTGAVMKARLDHLEIEDDGGKGLRLDVAGAVDQLVYKVAGRITDMGETTTLDAIKATVAGTEFAGRVSVKMATPLAVTAEISSPLIDVDALKPKDKGGKAEKAAPADKSTKDTAAKGDERVFPDDPLPVDGLKAVDANIKFKAAAVKASGLTVSDVHADVSLKGGKLAVRPAGAKFAGGDVALALTLDAGAKIPSLSLDVKGDKIDYGGLLKQLELTDMVSGNLSLALDASGKGMSVRTLMAGLDGGLKVTGKGGRLDLGALSVLSAGLGGLTDALKGKSDRAAVSEDAQTLRCIYLDFPIKKGISQAQAAVVETGGFAMIGEGGANLRDETLALRFQPRAKQASLATLVQPVTVGGTFANPSFGVEAEKALSGAAVGAAAAAVATGGLSVIVGGLIGAGSAQGTDDTDYCALAFAGKPLKPAEAKSASPSTGSGDGAKKSGGVVDGIGGALKGLFGK